MRSPMPPRWEMGRTEGQRRGSPHEVLSLPLGRGWGTENSGGHFTGVPLVALARDGRAGKGRSPHRGSFNYPGERWRRRGAEGSPHGRSRALTAPGPGVGADRAAAGKEPPTSGGGTAGAASAALYVIIFQNHLL